MVGNWGAAPMAIKTLLTVIWMNKLERQLPFGVEMIAVVISDNKIPYFWPENSCRRSRAQRSWLIFLTFNETNAECLCSGSNHVKFGRTISCARPSPRTKTYPLRGLIIKPSSSLRIRFPGYIFLFVEQKIKKNTEMGFVFRLFIAT